MAASNPMAAMANYAILSQAHSAYGVKAPLHSLRLKRGFTCKAFQEDTFSKYSGYISEGANEEINSMLMEYNPEKIASLYKARPLLVIRRLIQIGLKMGSWLGFRYLDSLTGQSDIMFKKRGTELRAALAELGPAFVKIAQAVSSRPDLIPPAYLEELSLLQDKIAPFSTDAALDIIELELGVKVGDLFSEISPEPIAAASLGQVYQARLRPSGETVAVKVQRPGVRGAIALDIFILRILAGYAKAAAGLNTDLQAVVDEWASSLFKEMDYEAEAQNGLKFRRLFGGIPNVKVPKMYAGLTSQRVLVMEWIEGEKLSEAKDLRMVEVGTYCSLTQLLDSGFYHADPHPGNLMCTNDGRLAYIDFGMMGEIKQDLRDALIRASLHLVNREFEALANDFVDLGFLPSAAPTADVTKALTGVFESAVSRGVSNLSFSDLSGNLGQTMYKFKFRIPSYFSLVIRSLTVLEGIAITIDRNYKVLGRSYPWIANKVLTDNSPALRTTLNDLIYKNGEFQIDRLESLITESTKWSQVASSIGRTEKDSSSRLLAFVFSDQADYVRDILMDQLAKGIDAVTRSNSENLLSSIGLKFQLVEPEDEKNIEVLQRISQLLSASYEADSQTNTIQLDPRLVWTIFELPFPMQQKLLSLPVDLAGKLISRSIARSIRASVN